MPIGPVKAAVGAAAAAGVAAGVAVALRNRSAKKGAQAAHQKVTVDDLEQKK